MCSIAYCNTGGQMQMNKAFQRLTPLTRLAGDGCSRVTARYLASVRPEVPHTTLRSVTKARDSALKYLSNRFLADLPNLPPLSTTCEKHTDPLFSFPETISPSMPRFAGADAGRCAAQGAHTVTVPPFGSQCSLPVGGERYGARSRCMPWRLQYCDTMAPYLPWPLVDTRGLEGWVYLVHDTFVWGLAQLIGLSDAP